MANELGIDTLSEKLVNVYAVLMFTKIYYGVTNMGAEVETETKYSVLADRIRAGIVSGKWTVGGKLPTWDELCRMYDVGRPTLTRAMTVLKREGFVVSKSTSGTFVSENPPNIGRYVMLFESEPSARGAGGWNLFWESLAAEALDYSGGGISIEVLFKVRVRGGDSRFAVLMDDARKRRIAGAIVVSSAEFLNLEFPEGFPNVFISGTEPCAGRCSVGLDWESFYTSAAEIMRSSGVKRVAVIANAQGDALRCAGVFSECGFCIPEKWALSMPGTHSESARSLVRLLFSVPGKYRPDGLVVADDNLLQPVLDGLAAENIYPGHGAVVAAHGNSGRNTANSGVKRLYFNSFKVISAALELLRKQSAGERAGAVSIRAEGF